MNQKEFNVEALNELGVGAFSYQLSPETCFLECNLALAKLFGIRSLREMKGKTLEKLFTNHRALEALYKKLKKDGRVQFFEMPILRSKNKTVWLAVTARLVKAKRGVSVIDGMVQDISSLKEYHEHLATQVDMFQEFLESMPDAIYFKDLKNRITKVNKFYAKGFKMKPEEVIGKTDFDFFAQDQAQKMFEDDNWILKTHKPIVGKVERTLLPNGTWNQVITTKVPMFDRKGKVMGTMGITRDMTAHANLEKTQYDMLVNALTVLEKALEMRDPYTYTHTRYVANIAVEIGKELGFEHKRLEHLRLAAELHDLGKISIPLDILIKPGRLTDLEFKLIQEHVDNCYQLIKDMTFPFPLAEIVYQHHERLDGSGYPRGIKGKKILLEARILAASDVLEAMTSHRPYRAALGIYAALEELKSGAGKKYDRKIVKVVEALAEKHDYKSFWIEK